jgi:hypothetical protein
VSEPNLGLLRRAARRIRSWWRGPGWFDGIVAHRIDGRAVRVVERKTGFVEVNGVRRPMDEAEIDRNLKAASDHLEQAMRDLKTWKREMRGGDDS